MVTFSNRNLSPCWISLRVIGTGSSGAFNLHRGLISAGLEAQFGCGTSQEWRNSPSSWFDRFERSCPSIRHQVAQGFPDVYSWSSNAWLNMFASQHRTILGYLGVSNQKCVLAFFCSLVRHCWKKTMLPESMNRCRRSWVTACTYLAADLEGAWISLYDCLQWKLSYATTYVLHVKDRKGMPLYEFQHKAMAFPVWRYLPFTKPFIVWNLLIPLYYVVLLCCLNMSEPWNRADENQQTQSNLFLRHLEQWWKALILERNKPGSLRGINFANTNNIVQPRCFPWRPDFCLRCGIFSNLAFDDPFKQNLPKNAEWTSIKFAVVICSSPHISQYSQSITR